MSRGVIKVADRQGVYVIKMSGDVRLTLSLSFDDFISTMFADANFCSVIFDLSEAVAIDSTTLGLMAKISLLGREQKFMDPIVISQSPGITRLLHSMGFNEILQIVEYANLDCSKFRELKPGTLDEEALRCKVLEAHEALIALDAGNKETFRELMQSLENR